MLDHHDMCTKRVIVIYEYIFIRMKLLAHSTPETTFSNECKIILFPVFKLLRTKVPFRGLIEINDFTLTLFQFFFFGTGKFIK